MAMDESYVQGMEDFCTIIRKLHELTTTERQEKFGVAFVADILDQFDFQQIREKMQIREFKYFYYMRGIRREIDGSLTVVADSPFYEYKPTLDMIKLFCDCNNADFVSMQEVYAYRDF